MALQFTNKQTAEKFEATVEKDVRFTGVGYSGLLSKVPPEVAERLIGCKSPHIRVKIEPPPVPKPSAIVAPVKTAEESQK